MSPLPLASQDFQRFAVREIQACITVGLDVTMRGTPRKECLWIYFRTDNANSSALAIPLGVYGDFEPLIKRIREFVRVLENLQTLHVGVASVPCDSRN